MGCGDSLARGERLSSGAPPPGAPTTTPGCRLEECTRLGACRDVRGARDRGGLRGQADRARNGGREAQVPLSGLHLLLGTLRTRAGCGSADSATPSAPCLSTFQSAGRTGDVGRGLSERAGGAEGNPNPPYCTDGGHGKGDSSTDWVTAKDVGQRLGVGCQRGGREEDRRGQTKTEKVVRGGGQTGRGRRKRRKGSTGKAGEKWDPGEDLGRGKEREDQISGGVE